MYLRSKNEAHVLGKLSGHQLLHRSRKDATGHTAAYTHVRFYNKRACKLMVGATGLEILSFAKGFRQDQTDELRQCAWAWTHERTNRSRLSQSGFFGLKLMNLLNIT